MEKEAVGRREALAKDILILSRNTLLVNLRFLDLALSCFALVPVPPLNPLLLESVAVDGAHMVFHKLLKEQSAVLNFLDEQRTAVINGAAGTGKTLVAVEKAKRHARRGEKVLFLCFNSQLKDYLSENFADENIEYSTIAGFACRLCHTPKPDYDALERLLMTMWENKSFPYRHVIVDEGQDFGSDDIAEVLETKKAIIEETTEDGSF